MSKRSPEGHDPSQQEKAPGIVGWARKEKNPNHPSAFTRFRNSKAGKATATGLTVVTGIVGGAKIGHEIAEHIESGSTPSVQQPEKLPLDSYDKDELFGQPAERSDWEASWGSLSRTIDGSPVSVYAEVDGKEIALGGTMDRRGKHSGDIVLTDAPSDLEHARIYAKAEVGGEIRNFGLVPAHKDGDLRLNADFLMQSKAPNLNELPRNTDGSFGPPPPPAEWGAPPPPKN